MANPNPKLVTRFFGEGRRKGNYPPFPNPNPLLPFLFFFFRFFLHFFIFSFFHFFFIFSFFSFFHFFRFFLFIFADISWPSALK